jgi:hypothetical protein
MADFKIVSNGHVFRIMKWNWFWPFWIFIKQYYGSDACGVAAWKTKLEAEQWIFNEIEKEKAKERPWLDV